jgi:protein-disulfide isomerase
MRVMFRENAVCLEGRRVTRSRRTVLTASAALATMGILRPTPAGAQTAPRPERTLSGADLTALNTPDEGVEDRVIGSANARVTIVEYASLTCPHCATFHTEVLPQVKARFVDSGQVRLIFRHFVLNILDAGASMMARCAPAERFYPILDVLFQQQRSWAGASDPVAALGQIALQAGFTRESFEACLRNQQILDRLSAQTDRAARRFGVNSTPTIFINGQMFRGALRVEQIEAIVSPMLRA